MVYPMPYILVDSNMICIAFVCSYNRSGGYWLNMHLWVRYPICYGHLKQITGVWGIVAKPDHVRCAHNTNQALYSQCNSVVLMPLLAEYTRTLTPELHACNIKGIHISRYLPC